MKMNNQPSQAKLAGVSQVPATCMGLHIRRASRIITQVYDAALRPVELAVNQFTLLVALHLLESVPITLLAQALFVDQTTLTRNLKLLEKRGLVAIAPGVDRRIRLASLTPRGHEIMMQAFPLWEQAQITVQQQLGPQKAQTLLSLLVDVSVVNPS